MHHLAGTHDLGAKSLPQCLVPQANTEDRHPAGKMPNGRQRDTGFVRGARARRDHQMLRGQPFDIGQLQFVVTLHQHFGT
ncbi:hypothetical protein D3C73_1095320 [compost metagenome]